MAGRATATNPQVESLPHQHESQARSQLGRLCESFFLDRGRFGRIPPETYKRSRHRKVSSLAQTPPSAGAAVSSAGSNRLAGISGNRICGVTAKAYRWTDREFPRQSYPLNATDRIVASSSRRCGLTNSTQHISVAKDLFRPFR